MNNCVMQSFLPDPMMNIGCIIAITNEFELWVRLLSQKASNNR